jgi:hypothetical protein
VQPLDLAFCVLEVEFRPRPVFLQAAMLLSIKQAVEVEAGCSLVLGLEEIDSALSRRILPICSASSQSAFASSSVAAFRRRYAESISSMSASLVIGASAFALFAFAGVAAAVGVGSMLPRALPVPPN